MKGYSNSWFPLSLMIVFLGAVGADLFRAITDIDVQIWRLWIYFTSSMVLSILLYFRLRETDFSTLWSIIGFIPPFAILFGVYLSVRSEEPQQLR